MGDIRSLFWLSRWYNDRSEKIQEIHDKHITNLFHLLISEYGNLLQGEQTVSLHGFEIRLSYSKTGLEIIAIEPPEVLDSIQLKLFQEEEEYAEIPA